MQGRAAAAALTLGAFCARGCAGGGCAFQAVAAPPEDEEEDAPVRFGMPGSYMTSSTDCARNWARRGWDAELLHLLALRTGNLGGCVGVGRGEVYANCTLTGGMLDLALGRVDVYGKARTQELGLRDVVDYLYPHKQENVCLLVQSVTLDDELRLPSLPACVWGALLPCLLAFAAALRLLHGLPLGDAALEVAGTLVTGMFAARHRRALVALAFLSLVLMNLVSGRFVGALVSPDEERETDTLVAADEQLRVIYSSSAAADAILLMTREAAEQNSTLASLTRKITIVRTAAERRAAVRAALESEEVAVMGTESILLAFQQLPEATRDGYSLFHRVRQCVLEPAYDAFAVRKGWRGRARMDVLLQRAVEGGVVAKVFSDGVETERRAHAGVRLLTGEPPPTFEALPLELMEPPLMLLACGLAAATLVFAGELALARYRRPRWRGQFIQRI